MKLNAYARKYLASRGATHIGEGAHTKVWRTHEGTALLLSCDRQKQFFGEGLCPESGLVPVPNHPEDDDRAGDALWDRNDRAWYWWEMPLMDKLTTPSRQLSAAHALLFKQLMQASAAVAHNLKPRTSEYDFMGIVRDALNANVTDAGYLEDLHNVYDQLHCYSHCWGLEVAKRNVMVHEGQLVLTDIFLDVVLNKAINPLVRSTASEYHGWLVND